MIDRAKVIKGLHCIVDGTVRCESCGYGIDKHGHFSCQQECAKDVITLLKEQEPQSVLSNRVCEAEPFRYVRKGFCPKCHQELEWLFNRKHCGFCGQAVKW